MANLNLDVDSPFKVAAILENAADEFYEAASEVSGNWQDKKAGEPWGIIAKILEKASSEIRRRIGE